MSDLKKAEDILAEARATVLHTRQDEYGDMREMNETIALFWTAYFTARNSEAPLEAYEVADMMELLKLARRVKGSYKRDNYVDSAGYAALAGALRNG